MSTVPRENCPDQELLQELAAGIGSPELAQRTMQHVARCRTCAAALRRYIREFSPEQSPEDIAILNQLKSSRPDWQKKLVREQLGGKKGFRWLKLAPAGVAFAAAVLGAFAGPTLLGNFKVMQANKQVAAAFAERRTTEMRLTAVEYSPYNGFPVTLGPEGGRGLDEVPTSLHEASGAANKNLQSSHADPRWLQIQGRALLWESTPSSLEKAEKDFEKAKAAGLSTPSLEIDLAVSYFERDSRTEHPNLQRTLNLLSEVLSKPGLNNDDRASALYDLAIAYEKTQAWDLAISTWEKYLAVDPTGAWADQARKHLKEGKEKTSTRQQQSYSDPSFFLQQKAQGNLRPEDPEQYQQKALTQWLPAAVRDRGNDSYRALAVLAETLAEKHSDLWMKEFIATISAKDSASVEALSAAVQENEKGHYGPAVTQAAIASRLFTQQNNSPGRLLAQFQEIYGKRSLLQGEACLIQADRLWEELSRTRYRWLQGQVALERAQCRNFRGDLADSDSDAKISLNLAENARFPVLELRVRGISASMQSQQGRCDAAWEQGTQGLDRYWNGNYPRDRLDQFYSVMWQCTEEAGSLYAAEVLLQHTITMREASAIRNPFREAMLHLRLRNMLLAQKQYSLADKEDAKAASLLNSLKKDEKIDAAEYRLINDIEPAELQLQQGDPQRALETITRVGEILKTVQSDFVTLNFNRVLGSIYCELKRFDEAAVAYQTAIGTAEAALESLKDGSERLKWLKATDDSYRGLVRVLLDQKKDKEALERWEWYQSRPILQGLHSVSRASPPNQPDKKIKTGITPLPLAPGTIRLIYANFKDGLQIWTSTSKGITGTWVSVKRQDFERMVRDFEERCSTPDSNLREVQEQGAWLYSQLLQPVISLLHESETVVVELDRSAYNLSVEALSSPAGWYFGERYAVIYSPGMDMDQSLRRPEPIDSKSQVFILDASRLPGAGHLPGMEAQRSAIAHIFNRTKIVESADTSWSDVSRQVMSSQVFHYMGHGKRDGSGTSLVFNSKEALRAKDIAPEVFSHPRLVVLAACSTALGRDNGLLDTNSLVHAFLLAGVPSVIASRWDVDSGTTSQLMISFYHNVSNRNSIAQAIFYARKEIMQNHPHPYYWASFGVTGRVS